MRDYMKKQNKLKLSAAQLKKLAGYADFEEETAQELKNDLAAQKAFLKVALDEYAQDIIACIRARFKSPWNVCFCS